MSDAPRNAFLVAHTHWDREWYLPFARFRVNLVEVVDAVLDALDHDPDLPHFLLDGQCAVLEDYLAVRPEARDRVHRQVREGRLGIGPWYVLPDEFLVSGEATARNLLFGRHRSPLGRLHPVGYMPDSFGHVAQMPQILQLAGLDNFVFTRGLDDRADETGWVFRWRGPDGSEVLAVNPCGGYCNAGGLGHDELWHAHTRRTVAPARAVAQVADLFAKLAQRSGGDPALLLNGCDHVPPQRDVGPILAALRAAHPDTGFEAGTLVAYLAALRADTPDAERPLLEGELLGGRDHPILSGVWSARLPLKLANAACQDLLTRVVEPLQAAGWAAHRDRWPAGLLQAAWCELLRNHPHDSICGCSIDAVHREMATRFATVRQTGRQMVARLLRGWTPDLATTEDRDGETVLCVANPLPRRRDAVIDRLVVLAPGERDLSRLRLVDADGTALPCEIVRIRYLERFWGVDYRAELFADDQFARLDTYLQRFGNRIIGDANDRHTHDTFVHLRFLARNLPAVGHRQYRLTGAPAAAAAPPDAVRAAYADDGARLENEHLVALLHPDGTIDLTDRATGRVFAGLNLLEDTEDRGDTYDWCPAPQTQSCFAAGSAGKVRLRDRSALRATAEAAFRFDLPRSLTPDRRERHPRTTPCDVTVRVGLATGSRLLEIATTFNNRAFDHRLRAWFPTGLETDEVVSDGVYGLDRRPLVRAGGPDWVQPAPRTWPQQDFSFLSDGRSGLAILNRGLPEFETIPNADGTAIYALTLLRCVDWLSRDDLATRNNLNAGPTLPTPDAQCIGRHTFRYAVMPCGGDLFAADVKGASDAWRTPVPVVQGVADGMTPGGVSLVAGSDPRVAITAIKRAERGEVLIVRLCNLAAEPVTETLSSDLPVLTAEKVSLVESELRVYRDDPTPTHGGRRVRVPLAPCEIATIALTLDLDP